MVFAILKQFSNSKLSKAQKKFTSKQMIKYWNKKLPLYNENFRSYNIYFE